jgi:hypothetical protein
MGEVYPARDTKVDRNVGIKVGTIGLHLWDKEGHRRAVIGLDARGYPGIACFDAEGKAAGPRAIGTEPSTSKESGHMGGIRLWLGINAEGTAGINVVDPSGRPVFTAP